jgi:hypothetical protein
MSNKRRAPNPITDTVVYAGRYRLEITPQGFTLWNNESKPNRRWMVDASKILTDGEVIVSGYTMRQKSRLLSNGFSNLSITFIAREL